MGRVWLITGCSSGLGFEIARAARSHRNTVIATARGNVGERLKSLMDVGCEAVSLDVTATPEDLRSVVDSIVQRHGRIDVLVNNAGMVQQGSIEETTPEETQAQFNVNFFGLLNLTRVVLPHMRSQKSGVVANIGSRAGRYGIPSVGLYNATKFALEGITEALAAEVASFNIQVTCIEPGDFRTAVFDASNTRTPTRPLPAYEHLLQRFANLSGTQIGDPEKGAHAIVNLISADRPIPIRLALGSDSADSLKKIYEDALQNLRDWDHVTRSTDYADA